MSPGRAATAALPAGPVAPGGGAAAALERSRRLVVPALARALGELDPWTGEMAAYAFGWQDVRGTPAPGASPGKGVRRTLAVLGAEAAGAPGGAAVPGAVAVELVHAFSLLHDDLMDGDETRRRRPALWKAYGSGPAVLAGDALFALAVRTVALTADGVAPAAMRRLSVALADLVRGQARDLASEGRPWQGPDAVSPREYGVTAELKTGSLLGCAVASGALLGGADEETVHALDLMGRHAGVAFQLVDDVLGIWGDPGVTGKPVHGDLRRGKKSYPLLAALADGGRAARELSALLAESEEGSGGVPFPGARGGHDPAEGGMDDARAARAAALAEAAGGRAAALAEAGRRLATARACLRAVPLDPGAADAIDDLLTRLRERTS
ncbi:polyprenyl synthetase family protein [Streptomyces zhihengii]|uniref:polyprenyl synthetase family protein n=1 Tax=Streptomyces zhihengii TaxID=1818004 RepID=UPI00369B94A9